MFDRALPAIKRPRASLEALVLLVRRELCLMDCELLLRKAQPGLGGREIAEEELQESRVT